MSALKGNKKSNYLLRRSFRPLLFVYSFVALLFLVLPIIIVIPMSFSSANSITFPPPGFSLRWYYELFGNPNWAQAAKTSVLTALIASTIALILGALAAYGLSKSNFRGKDFLIAHFTAPLIIPTIITGIALYLNFAKLSILGTFTSLVIAHTIIVVPYIILILCPIFETFDKKIELAARSLGASWGASFIKVVLPNLFPSVAGAWFFAFIMSFDEIIVTIFVAGGHMTIPKKMYNELVLQINPTITAVSSVLIILTGIFMMITLFLARKNIKRDGLQSFSIDRRPN